MAYPAVAPSCCPTAPAPSAPHPPPPPSAALHCRRCRYWCCCRPVQLCCLPCRWQQCHPHCRRYCWRPRHHLLPVQPLLPPRLPGLPGWRPAHALERAPESAGWPGHLLQSAAAAAAAVQQRRLMAPPGVPENPLALLGRLPVRGCTCRGSREDACRECKGAREACAEGEAGRQARTAADPALPCPALPCQAMPRPVLLPITPSTPLPTWGDSPEDQCSAAGPDPVAGALPPHSCRPLPPHPLPSQQPPAGLTDQKATQSRQLRVPQPEQLLRGLGRPRGRPWLPVLG